MTEQGFRPDTAVILAGGKGSRLSSITQGKIPKCLLEVNGVSIIERIITDLKRQQIARVAVSTGHLADVLEEELANISQRVGIEVVSIRDSHVLDTAGAVKLVVNTLGINRPFVLLNGDTLCDFDLDILLRSRGFPENLVMTILLHADVGINRAVLTSTEGRVLQTVLYPEASDLRDFTYIGGKFLINAGCYLVGPRTVERIPHNTQHSMDEWLSAVTKTGELYATIGASSYYNIGTPTILHEAELFWTEAEQNRPYSELSIEEKTWGQKVHVSKTDRYSVLRLQFNQGMQTSDHSHERTTKSHYITEGCFEFVVEGKSFFLIEGQEMTIPPNTRHRLTAITKGALIEITTEVDGEEDIVRYL